VLEARGRIQVNVELRREMVSEEMIVICPDKSNDQFLLDPGGNPE